MRVLVAACGLLIGLGWVSNGSADIVNGETSVFVYDFSDGNSAGSAFTGSNAYVTLTNFIAESPTEGSQPDSNPIDSGIGGISNRYAYVQTHITNSSNGANPPTNPLSSEAYQTFSVVNLHPSNRFSLNSISFDMNHFGLGVPFNIGELKVNVWISNDGFATFTDVGGGTLERLSNTSPTPSPINVSLDLSTFAEFQEISNNVDIRLVYTDSFDDNQIETRIDNVSLSLTAIPEPVTLPLVGCVAIIGLMYRRREN